MLTVKRRAYRLEVDPSGRSAAVSSPSGALWLSVRLFAALDRTDGVDETLALAEPRLLQGREPTLVVERRSTLWQRAGLTLVCGDDRLEVRTWVAGRGRLTDVHLLGGRSLLPRTPLGFMPSGSAFRTLFTPNPEDAARLVRDAREPVVIGVSGDSEPGRGRWLFTPAPLYLALTTDTDVTDPGEPVSEGWLDLGLAAPVAELGFLELAYRPAEGAFSLLLDYDGHTAVDGIFHAPALVLTPGVGTPYAGIRRHRDDLATRGFAPQVRDRHERDVPPWWREPIFCGWGAQCALARETGEPAATLATQANYDAFLERLEREGVVPGTIVVDDKWQSAYGTNEPDEHKWPDLKGWIASRHARGQRVLLWWKAWDPEGLPDELCVRDPDGRGVAVDPTDPGARDELRRVITAMLDLGALDADGLKVDFTARTPRGRALYSHGGAWGIALLHELLAIVYSAAKDAKHDALVITHTPHPSFVGVTDMIRLNDMLRTDDPGVAPGVVREMRYRARVAQSACPELLIDTDDWRVPDRESWRAYLAVKPQFGVPALYYADRLDATGELLTADDYAALRRTWSEWRSAQPARAQ